MKRKVLASIAAAAVCFGAAHADSVNIGENGYQTGGFVGIRGGYTFSIQSSVIGLPGGSFLDDSYKGNGGTFGIQLGGQEGQWRAALGYEYFDNSDDQNYDLFLLEVDYFVLPDASMYRFQPYLGLDLGYLNYETTGAPNSSGMAYGLSAGVNVPVTEHVDVDLGVRYLFATQDEVDHIGTVNVSLNYYY
ncbi:hypothetical protein [Nitratifractor sp.]